MNVNDVNGSIINLLLTLTGITCLAKVSKKSFMISIDLTSTLYHIEAGKNTFNLCTICFGWHHIV